MKRLILLIATFVAMLSTPALAETDGAFFAAGSIEHQFNGDDFLTPGCTFYPHPVPKYKYSTSPGITVCTGNNPRAEFKLGYEFAFGDWRDKWYVPILQLGFKHESNWFSGPPFNEDRELWSNSWFLEFKLGGLR